MEDMGIALKALLVTSKPEGEIAKRCNKKNEPITNENVLDLIYRLRKRAEIRRHAKDRKSVQEGKPDRISDLLEEAAKTIETIYASGHSGE